MYEHGDGVKIDFKTAAHWYRRAVELGHPYGQYNLGAAFYSGRGVPQSNDEAVRWWRLAAAQGQPDALYGLGVCYEDGHGVPRDDRKALSLYKRAAVLRHARAADIVAALLADPKPAAISAPPIRARRAGDSHPSERSMRD